MRNSSRSYDDIIVKHAEDIISEITHDPEVDDDMVHDFIWKLANEICSNAEDSVEIINLLSNRNQKNDIDDPDTIDAMINFARNLVFASIYEEVRSLVRLRFAVEYENLIGTFVKCGHCGTVFSVLIGDRFPFDIETPSGKALCNECITTYSICDECDEYYLTSTSPFKDICGSCAWDEVMKYIDDESRLRTYSSTM